MTEIIFDHEDFDFETLEEELKVDEQCRKLLQQFYLWLQQQNMTTEHASELAYSVDFYLRDYVLDFLRCNALRPQKGQVRYFAGNWYITRTMDPEITVLERHLEGVGLFYAFLHELHLITPVDLAEIKREIADLDYFQQRIEGFMALAGDGYEDWNRACPCNVEKGSGCNGK